MGKADFLTGMWCWLCRSRQWLGLQEKSIERATSAR